MDSPSSSRSDGMQLPDEIPDGMIPDAWGWVSDQRNMDAHVQGTKVFFHPTYAFGTAAVRGERRLTSSMVAYWEIEICQPLYGTSIMFGVGNGKAKTISRSQFVDLLGNDCNSYGLNHQGYAYHGGLSVRVCRELESNCVVGVLFDGPNQRVSYFENGKRLYTPFVDIDLSRPLYPMMSSTAQQSRFVVKNQHVQYVVRSLYDTAIRKVFACHAKTCAKQLNSLPLPRPVLCELRAMATKRRIPDDVPTHGRKHRKRASQSQAHQYDLGVALLNPQLANLLASFQAAPQLPDS